MLKRLGLLGAVSACALSACVTSPQSHTWIDPNVHDIDFTGLATYQHGLRVEIQVKNGKGAYQTLATAAVNKEGHWATTASVADKYFGGLCGHATFRAVTKPGGQVLKAADGPCLSHLPIHPTQQQIEACTTTEIVIERGGAATYTGTLVIDGPAEAKAYQCLTEVNGDLILEGGNEVFSPGFARPGLETVLPKLAHVTGNLSVDGDRAARVALPLLTEVGGNLSLTMAYFGTYTEAPDPADDPVYADITTAIELPLVATVGGSIDLHNERENTPVASSSHIYNFGLPLLTSLGGDVNVLNSIFPATMYGLSALTTIHGNVLVDWGPSDLFTVPLLDHVTHVEGNFELAGPPNARGLMGALATVDGNVSIHRASGVGSSTRMDPHLLEGLAHIGGNLTLDRVGTEAPCHVLLPGLSQLEGALQISNSDDAILFGATGGSHLSLGSLSIEDSQLDALPLSADAVVSPSGAISVTNNSKLCPCVVDAFIALQQTSGWLGSATNTGNGASAACGGACPATFCP
jgi:hypothetical protein